MKILGIKLTHDAGIAVIQDNRLLLSYELEKINNNARFSHYTSAGQLLELIALSGISLSDIDHVAIDGWHAVNNFDRVAMLALGSDDRKTVVKLAPYCEEGPIDDVLRRITGSITLSDYGKPIDYSSYSHFAGHIMGAYCTSPFSKAGASSFVLVWDGGQYPRLYYIDYPTGKVTSYGPIFFLLGTIYSIMAQYFGPFKKTEEQLAADYKLKTLDGYFGGLSVAGKMMAYIAVGTKRDALPGLFDKAFKSTFQLSQNFEHKFCKEIRDLAKGKYADEDILCTLHHYLEDLLISALRKKIARFTDHELNLCYTGGCALNIKWNSALRSSGIFRDIWIPPFPNDSGSAIGVACCEMGYQSKNLSLDWDIYSGPSILENGTTDGWVRADVSLADLARLLHNEKKPVLFLSGKAELGPRALGHRSIIAPACIPDMKQTLNTIKNRESYRPVAPICLEEYASVIFEPGVPDPFMLFDHKVRPDWADKIPAICHLDGTARVQTINEQQNPTMYRLLKEYHQLSGIPVLCNTSGNLSGSGFFYDTESASRWGRVDYIWCNEILYSKAASTAKL